MAHSCRSFSWVLKRLEVFLLPLDRMLVQRRLLPRNCARFPQQFVATHSYTWVETGTVRVKCLTQEYNTKFPARAHTQTACSRDKCTNHEATLPPVLSVNRFKNMRDFNRYQLALGQSKLVKFNKFEKKILNNLKNKVSALWLISPHSSIV